MGVAVFTYTSTAIGGGPESGALVYAFTKGTTTPAVCFSDSGLSIPTLNPVVSDADGRSGAIYFDDTKSLTFRVKTADGATTLLQVDFEDGVFSATYAQIEQLTLFEEDDTADGAQTHVLSGVAVDNPWGVRILFDGIEQPVANYSVFTDGTDTTVTYATNCQPALGVRVLYKSAVLQALSPAAIDYSVIDISDANVDSDGTLVGDIRGFLIGDAIANGETDQAPTQNAVFDALALKVTAAGGDASATVVTATGSTTARTAAKRAADVFHVLDEGAVPDGVTSATAAILSTIAKAVARGGGTVVIGGDTRGNDFLVTKVGGYGVRSTAITSDIVLRFEGGARLVAASGLNVPVLDLATVSVDQATWEDVDLQIEDPTIDCSAGDSSTPGTQQCTAINLSHFSTVVVNNPYLYGGESPYNLNADSGISSVNCGVITVNDGIIRGFNDGGVYPNGTNTVGADGDGRDFILNNVTIQRCLNTATVKRELNRFAAYGGRVEECISGFVPATITSPSFVGPCRRMDIEGVFFKKVTANCWRFPGPVIGSVKNCTVEDWGYDYDGTGSVGANAVAGVFQGTRDVDIVGNSFRMVDWTRVDQRAYSFANVTQDSILYTHGNCRFSGNSYRGIARITVWTNTGEAHDFSGEYLEDISGTKFANGTAHADTIIEYREYGQSVRQIWKNGVTYTTGPIIVSATDKILGRSSASAGPVEEITFTDQAQALADDTSFQDMCATLGTWKVLAISGAAASRSSVNAAGDSTEQTLATIAVPANAMGANGAIRITTLWSCTGSANVKTVFSRWGGGTLTNTALTNLQSLVIQRTLFNRNVTNAQIAWVANNGNSFTSVNAVPATYTRDTTASQSITLTAAWAGATAAETITLEAYLVELLYSS